MRNHAPHIIELEREDRLEAVRLLREFFQETREEELSEFQAAALLDFFLRHVGPGIYNRAIADSHAFLLQKLDDLYGLEKRIIPVERPHSP
jgi:uncharacterized protein (DUF2164 family)